MTNSTRSILATIFVLVIAFCATFMVSSLKLFGRMDFTEDKLYTLTEGTRSILRKLDQPLTVKLFYAKEAANKSGQDFLLQFNNYYYYIRDLLTEYAGASGGKLAFEEYDPRRYSDAEVEADRLQMQRFPITERDGFYFGLAVTSDSGAKQTIPFLSPQEQALIEYKISEAIDLASRTKKTKLGVLSSLSVTGGGLSPYMRQMMAMQGRQPEQPWAINEVLAKHYDVVDVAKDADAIDADVDFLLVIHPKDLEEKTLYAIDQYVMRGGKALVFVDPFCMADQPPRNPQNPMANMGQKQSSSLDKLLKAWGVTVAEDKFAGDLTHARRIPGSRQNPEMVRFAGLLDFTDDSFNPEEVAVSGLKQVTMLFPGAIKKTDPIDGVQITPLITTGADGNEWSAQSWELGGPMGMDVPALAAKFQPGVERLWTAARITGKLKSAFPAKPGSEAAAAENGSDGEPKDGEAKDGEAKGGEAATGENEATGEDKPAEPEGPEPADDGHLAQCAEPTTVFVVADVDILTDSFAFVQTFFGLTPQNSNSAFLLNALEQLAGSADLIGVRSRGAFRRPFDVVDEIEAKADLRTREQVARINADIQKFEAELAEINNQATEKNVGLLQNEAIQKQRNVEAEIRAKKRELREVQQDKLAAIEAEGAFWKNFTRIFVPFLVLVVGVALALRRYNVRKTTVLGGVS